MRKADVEVGKVYSAKVSGNLVIVRLDRESRYGGWEGTNLYTGRRVRLKTAGRLRSPVPESVVQRMIDRDKIHREEVKKWQEGKWSIS